MWKIMPRFFIDAPPVDTFIITGADAKHAAASLRIRPGEAVTLCDGNKMDYNCICTFADAAQVGLKVIDFVPSPAEPSCEIALFQCLPKGDKMDEIIQKSVELGVAKIIPVLSQRCISRPDGKALAKRAERWNKISKEAAMQSGRGIIPTVENCVDFDIAVSMMSKGNCPILLYEQEKNVKLSKAELASGCSILVGPEGGISKDEARLAAKLKIKHVTLGPRILRTETAGPAAIAIINFIMEA